MYVMRGEKSGNITSTAQSCGGEGNILDTRNGVLRGSTVCQRALHFLQDKFKC